MCYYFLNFRADGKPGSGKSMTLAHVLHYAYTKEFIIVYIPFGKFDKILISSLR